MVSNLFGFSAMKELCVKGASLRCSDNSVNVASSKLKQYIC